MPRALILIGAHLTTAPRPYKEAVALAEAGWDVVVAGAWFDPALAARDEALLARAPFRFVPVVDARSGTLGGALRRGRAAIQRRLAGRRYRSRGRVAPELLGIAVREQLDHALSQRADLTIAHAEGGLWAASRLLAAGLRVGVDFEDWFSEDLLPAMRASRPIATLAMLERELLRRAHYRVAASAAMAGALAMRYDVTPPDVVYNAFPREHAPSDPGPRDRVDRRVPSLHWFSQTIGPGRGLELLAQALPLVHGPVEVHVRGDGRRDGVRWLRGLLPPTWREAVHVHPTVANAELPARIAEHDIGLALEIPHCLNRELTATNKLFQYLEGGLAVVATRTRGQEEVLRRCPGAGTLVPPDDPGALAAAVNRLLDNPQLLGRARQAAAEASAELAWDRQAEVIVAAATRAIQPRARAAVRDTAPVEAPC